MYVCAQNKKGRMPFDNRPLLALSVTASYSFAEPASIINAAVRSVACDS
jgi:hypothetical protein